ncbi:MULTISPECIES: MalY/PatB family protein [Aestuariimicrobium]|uniref:MalY/PatB family protein n=1 Tax=Aestuariimicrobium TaxID=396388 RepID=UPI0003B35F07|nr:MULTISPECIES: aminotransferase class I/II-fold pyridoxal phosphate-dependent enzyme [Aestuariimicrobium]CAI9407731.1 Cystathionine beta-lyase [Aestuariimicrobium sp. T2.26MG-19.2B]
MSFADRIDALTPDDLVARGSGKWTRFPGTLGAFVAEHDFGLADPIAEALHRMVDGFNFGYLPDSLAHEMCEATAHYVRRYGWQLEPRHVTPLPDVLSGLEIAMDLMLAEGAKVILPTPAYMPFLTMPGRARRELVEVPMLRTETGWEYDFDSLDKVYEQGDLLILCNPHNPIGKVATREELTRLSEIVDAHHGLVYNDEIHAPLVFGEAVHVPYHALSEVTAGHTVTSMAASKAWNLPGLKAAQFIVTSPSLRELWEPIAFGRSHGTATPGVVATVAAYTQGQPWLDEVLTYLDGTRVALADAIASKLPGVGHVSPQGTYLAWLETADLGLENPQRFFLEDAKVALTDGAACGAAGVGDVRLNFGTARPIVLEMIDRMARALEQR